MSNFYNRPPITDTTGYTPPMRTGEKRTSKRAEQITHLHQEFQDLKQKIKEVESKNEKIIEKIHRAYNFKKKNAYTEEYLGETTPVIHYESKMYGYHPMRSADEKSNKSQKSDLQMRLQKRSTGHKKYPKNQMFSQSMEYGKKQPNLLQQDSYSTKNQKESLSRSNIQQMGTPPVAHHSYEHNSSQQQLKIFGKKMENLDEQLQFEKEKVLELEKQLGEKDIQLSKLRVIENKFKNYSKNIKKLIQNQLEQFYQNVMQKNFTFLEKNIKKNDNKLKAVKNLAMKMKDKQEEKKSNRLIEIGKRRRSKSRSRRDSPTNNQRQPSRSRSKIKEQNEKNKEFQEIANRYEELIKVKTEQIQKWDKKYRTKERQCYELKMRADVLQKKLCEEEKRSCKNESISSYQLQTPQNQKKFSYEGNLLNQDQDQKSLLLAQSEEKIKKLTSQISTLENKIKIIHNQYQEKVQKTKLKLTEDFQIKVKEYQLNLSQKNREIVIFRSKFTDVEKKLLEKDCEAMASNNKLKKYDSILESKDKKIEQLEKLLTSAEQPHGECLEKSGSVDVSVFNSDSRKLEQMVEKMQLQLEEKKNEIYSLVKNNEFYKTKVEELENIVQSLTKELESLQIENEQMKINANIQNISSVTSEQNIDMLDLNQQKLEANEKIMSLEKDKKESQQKYQMLKANFLKKQSQFIKVAGQLDFMKSALESTEQKMQKMREDYENSKVLIDTLQDQLKEKNKELEVERIQNQAKINELERQWIQFQEQMKNDTPMKHQDFSDMKSQRSSLFNYKNKYDSLATQNQYLSAKLKEAESQIQMQKKMENKIISEYQSNIEKAKIQIKTLTDESQSLKSQNDILQKKVSNLNLRINSEQKKRIDSKSDQVNDLFEKIQNLESQLHETKDINSRLTEMQGQLFKEMKLNEEEKVQLLQELENKKSKIKELEELLEIKESGNSGNPYGSHISSSSHKKQSLKSQSSLKYSASSQLLMSGSRFGHSRKSNEDKMIDLDLSEAGSSFFEQPSQFSNVEQIFEREELPYEKMKIKRKQQIKLLEKTSSYIKSLKKAIDEKNKKIKVLEKKIESLKASELVRKGLGPQEKQQTVASQFDVDDTFRDYQSVQLDRKRGGYLRKYKQLEDDTKLVMQENQILTQQIEGLEQELLKAQEQENSLVKIKDLYKQQIKKLIKKNEEQTKAFEQELKSERMRVEESQSVHNMQAIKQLLYKIMQLCWGKLSDEHMSGKKREQKRKQLEEYTKILANILKLQKKMKQQLLSMIQK